jgi:hypothetical protein
MSTLPRFPLQRAVGVVTPSGEPAAGFDPDFVFEDDALEDAHSGTMQPPRKPRASSFGLFSLRGSQSNPTQQSDTTTFEVDGGTGLKRGVLGASFRKLKDSSESLTRSLSARVPKVTGRSRRTQSVQLPKRPSIPRVKSEPRPHDNGVARLPTISGSLPTPHSSPHHSGDAGGPSSLRTIPQSPSSAQQSPTAPPSNSPRQTSAEVMSNIAIPNLLRLGTPMTKVSAKKQKHVLLKLDPEQGQIVYMTTKLRYSEPVSPSYIRLS